MSSSALIILDFFKPELIQTAEGIVAHGKGLLSADESTGTIGKRFRSIGVENTVSNRKNYRELLVTAEGIEQFISGVIFYRETLFQERNDGTSFVRILQGKGIIPGIKVDMGIKDLYNGEYVTQGLDNLDERCKSYYTQGARFAKWRAVLNIKDIIGATPSTLAITSNADALARFASICQHNGLVPIIEPEVLCDGDFSIEVVEIATKKVLSAVFKAAQDHGVLLEATILKPNMVRSGSGATIQALPVDIAAATLRVLKDTVPSSVAGIAFLSGGMTEEEASLALNAINQEAKAGKVQPWPLTFSFGRALQTSCLQAWQGSQEQMKVVAAQNALFRSGKAASLATKGSYSSSEEVLGENQIALPHFFTKKNVV